jgi:hypothetical protein
VGVPPEAKFFVKFERMLASGVGLSVPIFLQSTDENSTQDCKKDFHYNPSRGI